MTNYRNGFTIVELLVVVVVVSILASITVVTYRGIQERGRDSQRKSDIALIQKALEVYKSDQGGYPACNGGTYQAGTAVQTCQLPDADITAALVPNYIGKIPSDPINSGLYTYLYMNGQRLGTNGCDVTGVQSNNFAIGVRLEASPAICTSSGWWSRSDLGLIVGSAS